MRPLLLGFLVEVHEHCKLQQETIHLAVNFLDRYMSEIVVPKRYYQLVGMVCLWLAAKYEDGPNNAMKSRLLYRLCSKSYNKKVFAMMEKHVLKTLKWDLSHPTAEVFLQRESKDEHTTTKHVAQFLLELSLFYPCFISCGSSTISSSCLYLARHILGLSQEVL